MSPFTSNENAPRKQLHLVSLPSDAEIRNVLKMIITLDKSRQLSFNSLPCVVMGQKPRCTGRPQNAKCENMTIGTKAIFHTCTKTNRKVCLCILLFLFLHQMADVSLTPDNFLKPHGLSSRKVWQITSLLVDISNRLTALPGDEWQSLYHAEIARNSSAPSFSICIRCSRDSWSSTEYL